MITLRIKVWKNLGSYLNLDDLKDCRLICQLFNTKIMGLKSLQDRANLNIPLSKFPASDLGKTGVKWRHLAINVDLDQEDRSTENWWDSSEDPLPDLSQLLSSIISLKLYRTDYCSFGISSKVLETLAKILPIMLTQRRKDVDQRGNLPRHKSVLVCKGIRRFNVKGGLIFSL